MALYSNLRDYRFANGEERDIRGAAIYGVNDEKLGTIDDAIFDSSSGDIRYVVVDTGGWLTSKKFVVPARHLMIREEADKDFHVSLTKAQIEQLPEYREQDLESEENWTDYESRYSAAWTGGPVLHRKGSTHSVTPEAAESPMGTGAGDGMKHASPRRIAHDMPRFGATSGSDEAAGGTSLAGETDYEPVISKPAGDARGALTRQIDEPAFPDGEGKESDSELPAMHTQENVRMREFQEELRRHREEIMRRRQDGRAA